MNPGDLLAGRYRVIEKIREGGMGALYRAEDIQTARIVAVKMLRAELKSNAEAHRRFVREAAITRRLAHPNLVSVLDVVDDEVNPLLLVMEFLEGLNLQDELKEKGKLPVSEAAEITLQALNGLAYLHGKGIVHRDVSPENLMIGRDASGRLSVKLIDFGIARDWTEEAGSSTALFVGKIRYSSPEQLGAVAKGTPLDGRSDLYSLGCVLYLMVTGEHPVVADTPMGYIMAHIQEGVRPFSDTDPDGLVPEPVRDVIARAVERDRERRLPSAAAFSEAIRVAVPESTLSARPAADMEKTWVLQSPATERGPSGRFPLVRISAGVVVLAVVAGLVWKSRSRTPEQIPAVPSPAVAPSPPQTGDGILIVTSFPWSRILSIESEETGRPLLIGDLATPARLTLPSGRYKVTLLSGPLEPAEQAVKNVIVVPGSPLSLHVTYPRASAETALEAFLK
ncbi:MAG: serine/threonine protein kinase [Acidobacteria bacterium]|nr:serine/threonine protein kinase [Acidobacteriota bacterium]